MDNSTIQKIRDILSKNDNIAIAVGKNPSIDEMAASLSLYLILKEANKKVVIGSPTQPIVELSNLVGIDKVQSRLDNQSGDLVVSFPYVEGEIEKVSYTLENGFLNIIVKASDQGLAFDEKDVKYSKGGEAFGVLFVIGTPNLSDLGDLISHDKLGETKIINIDNNPQNQGYGDIVAVSANFSSLSEQVADIILSLGFRIDKDAAQNLLNGIMYSTQNFQSPSTSPLAFEIASLLMRNGAKRERPSSSSSSVSGSQFQRVSQIRNQDRSSSDEKQPLRGQVNNSQNTQESEDQQQKPPTDWLAPKVYKGSSNF